jgi:hypothetical protein
MGISLISQTGGGEGPRVLVQMPVTSGLQLLSYFGQTIEQSRANRASRGAALATTLATLPTVTSNKITLDDTAAITFPNSVETANFTLILAGRAVDATQASNSTRFAGVGWHDGGVTRGAQLYSGGATVMRYRADFTVSALPSPVLGSLAYTSGQQNIQRMWAFVVTDGVGMTLYDLTNGTSSTVSNTTTRQPYTAIPLKIGPYLGGDGGQGDYYALAHHTVALTKPEIDAQAEFMARFLKDVRGVTGLIPTV